MISSAFGPGLSRRDTSKSIAGNSVNNAHGNAAPLTNGGGVLGLQSAGSIYQHIQEMASKRISTLDYLRKSYQGRIYWFNTVHFSKADLRRMSYFEPRKLSRRAVNYLLLGLSLPPILDVNSTAFDYLRALNALLLEFDAFQQAHSPEGNSSSSLARSRIPQIFRRATQAGSKTRRASLANDIGLPIQQTSDSSDSKSMTGSIASSASASAASASFPQSNTSDLLPGEEYTYLLTPSLPFEPDFFETFTTLCDVLIDCYSRLVALIPNPSVCTVTLGELFSKADARLRKVMVSGVIREFEDSSRNSARSEVAGVSRVVLGGLLG